MGKCVNCSAALTEYSEYRFKSEAFRNVYRSPTLFACVACSLKQADNSIISDEDLTSYYRKSYRTATGIAGDGRAGVYLPRAASLVELARSRLKHEPTRIFEVGAGHGHNLTAFGEAFPNARLCTDEIDESVRLSGRIAPDRLYTGGWDVVIMSHVLEHFRDPRALVRSAWNALSPGGVIVIEVPNETADALTIQPHHEPHLSFYDVQTLRDLLAGIAVEFDVFTVGRRIDRPGRIPALLRRVSKKLRRIVSSRSGATWDDFSTRVPGGRFLRAVVQR